MTLDKAVVRLGRAASSPGVAFVALSRVRHPDALMLDDEFPDMATIMRQTQSAGYIKRQEWEKLMKIRFSQTLRRHLRDPALYDPEMTWTEEESTMAADMLRLLKSAQPGQSPAELEELLLDKLPHANPHTLKRVWKRMQCWPHRCEVDNAYGKGVDNECNTAASQVDFTQSTYAKWTSNRWNMPSVDWFALESNGTLSVPLFEHFAGIFRKYLPASIDLLSPYLLNKLCNKAAEGEEPALPAPARRRPRVQIYPYRTKSKHWILYFVENKTADSEDDCSASISVLAAKNAPEEAYSFATHYLSRALATKEIRAHLVAPMESADVVIFDHMISYINTHATSVPAATNCNLLLFGSIHYVAAVVIAMTNAGTSDMDRVIDNEPSAEKMRTDFHDLVKRLCVSVPAKCASSATPVSHKRKDTCKEAAEVKATPVPAKMRHADPPAKRMRTRAATSTDCETGPAKAADNILPEQNKAPATTENRNSSQAVAQPVGIPLPKMRRLHPPPPRQQQAQPTDATRQPAAEASDTPSEQQKASRSSSATQLHVPPKTPEPAANTDIQARTLRVHAAETRRKESENRGIGDATKVEHRTAAQAKRESAGTSNYFGAARATELRSALQRSRASASASETATTEVPLPTKADPLPNPLPVPALAHTSAQIPLQDKCVFCARLGFDCLENSNECSDHQITFGCHACGRQGCFRMSPECHFAKRGFLSRLANPDARTDGKAAPNLSLIHI